MDDTTWQAQFDAVHDALYASEGEEMSDADLNPDILDETDDESNQAENIVPPPPTVPLSYEKMAGQKYFESESLYAQFPATMIRNINIKATMNRPEIRFALLVIRNHQEFSGYVKKAENVLSHGCEAALKTIDDNAQFTIREMDTLLHSVQSCLGTITFMKRLRKRILEWKKKLTHRKKAMRPVVDPVSFNQTETVIQQTPRDFASVIAIFRRTAPSRFSWMKSSPTITVATVLTTFTQYTKYGQCIIRDDFDFLTVTKPKRHPDLSKFFRENQRNLLRMAIDKKLTTLQETRDTPADLKLLELLPSLFKAFGSRSKKAANTKAIFYPKLDCIGLKSAKHSILRLQVRHTFISCVTHENGPVYFVALMDNLILINGDAFDALDVFFKCHYAFDFDPDASYKFVYEYLHGIAFETSKTPAGFDNFLDALQRMADIAEV